VQSFDGTVSRVQWRDDRGELGLGLRLCHVRDASQGPCPFIIIITNIIKKKKKTLATVGENILHVCHSY